MDKTWVLIADRVRARLFKIENKGEPLVEIRSFINPSGRQAKGSRGDKRPGRTMESVGSARHSIEPHTTPEEKHAEEFARVLNNVLETGRSQHDYAHLVLIAPPRFLGALRSAMGTHIAPLVIKEIERDLTEASAQDISAYLRD